MKKILLIILTVVVVAAGATMVILSTNKPTVVQRDKIEDALFCYLNLDQLAKKGAFDKYITSEQRKMWASMATANVENQEIAAHIESIITNFNNSGIDFTKPVYGYLDNYKNFVFVAKVADAIAVDNSINTLSYLIELDGEEPIEISQIDDERSFDIGENVFGLYNSKRFTIVMGENEMLATSVSEAAHRNLADCSIFGNSDIATYINANKIKDLLYESELVDNDVDDAVAQDLSQYLGEDAHIISSLTFEPGRIVATNNCYNFNTEKFEGLFKRCNNDHLDYISEDAIAVLNFGLEGKMLSELITEFINSDLSNILGINLHNEERMALAVACDAIESINGDTTIVLESIDGTLRERFNYYTGDVNYLPEMKSFNAAMMMDVSDSYIITNVGQYAMGLLLKVDDNHYASQFGNYNITLLHRENLLFGGVNMKPTKAEYPASKAVWAKDIEESYGYAVINFNSLRESKFTGSIYDILIEELGIEYDNTLHSLKQMLSYAYTTSEDILCYKSVVVLNDESTNSLEQFTSILIPVIISEMSASIF